MNKRIYFDINNVKMELINHLAKLCPLTTTRPFIYLKALARSKMNVCWIQTNRYCVEQPNVHLLGSVAVKTSK